MFHRSDLLLWIYDEVFGSEVQRGMTRECLFIDRSPEEVKRMMYNFMDGKRR